MESFISFLLQNNWEWKEIRGLRISEVSRSIIKASWANNTTKQYNFYLQKFKEFCLIRGNQDYLTADLELAVDFLSTLFSDGHSFSSISTARSAISQHVCIQGVNCDFGKHPVTVKFMRGVFKLRKPIPRYKSTWDVNIVLDQLRKLDNKAISLKQLSFKTVMLLALCTSQRTQTLAELKLSNARIHQTKIVFLFDVALKTSRPGCDTKFEIFAFDEDSSICPFTCVNEYIDRTSLLRGQADHLFISFQKPHGKVTSQTIGRWLSTVLKSAGIHELYSAHSVRGASASKAASRTDINLVLKVAGWARAQTFARFYQRSIETNDADFTEAVLRS